MAWEMFLKGSSPIKGEILSVLQATRLTYAKNLAQAAQTVVAMRDIGGIKYSTKDPGSLIHSLMQKPLASKKWRIWRVSLYVIKHKYTKLKSLYYEIELLFTISV